MSKGGMMSWSEANELRRQGDGFARRGYVTGRPVQYSPRRLSGVWDAMLKASKGGARKPAPGFSSAAIAKATGASARYVRAYILALDRAGYLETLRPFQSPHAPALYKVSEAYRDAIAPQLAGGSGGGGRLGNMWRTVPDKARIARKQLPAKRKGKRK